MNTDDLEAMRGRFEEEWDRCGWAEMWDFMRCQHVPDDYEHDLTRAGWDMYQAAAEREGGK